MFLRPLIFHRPCVLGSVGAVLLLLGGCPDDDMSGTSATEATSADDSGYGEPVTGTGTGPTTGAPTTGSLTSTTTTATSTMTDTEPSTSTGADSTMTAATEGGEATDATGATGTTGGTTGGSSTGDATGTTSDAGDCGDGVVDAGEECDLGEEKNGGEAYTCTDACTWDGVIVFLSSAMYVGSLGGLEGADALCQTLAADAGLSAPLEYRAWLSIDGQVAKSRIPLVEQPYVRLDAKKIATKSSDLLDGKLLNPITITESMDEVELGLVWTNTTSGGLAVSTFDDCKSFSDGTADEKGYFGLAGQTDGKWTNAGLTYCEKEAHLYCFSKAF